MTQSNADFTGVSDWNGKRGRHSVTAPFAVLFPAIPSIGISDRNYWDQLPARRSRNAASCSSFTSEPEGTSGSAGAAAPDE